MTTAFNTRSGLARFADAATFAVMVGMTVTTAAMAYTPSADEPVALPERLPTVVVTNQGAYTLEQLPTVIVIAKRGG